MYIYIYIYTSIYIDVYMGPCGWKAAGSSSTGGQVAPPRAS